MHINLITAIGWSAGLIGAVVAVVGAIKAIKDSKKRISAILSISIGFIIITLLIFFLIIWKPKNSNNLPTTVVETMAEKATAAAETTVRETTSKESTLIVNVVISGKQGWQSTGVTVDQGQKIQIIYKDGTWAGRVGFGPSLPDIWTDAGGIDFQIYYPEFGITGRFASLIGKIGDGPILQVGRSYDAISAQTGTLYLRMFDTGMDDNAGSITEQIIVEP